MPSFKIAQPTNFTVKVPIPQVGLQPAMVPITFKHRNREEIAELYDQWDKQVEQLRKSFEGKEPTLAEVTAAEIDNSARQVKDLVVSWGFDDKFNDENVRELVKSCMGVSDAIVQAYGDAYTKARLGN